MQQSTTGAEDKQKENKRQKYIALAVGRFRGVVGVGFDGVLADKVNKMKFFCSGRVGDGDTIFVNTACRQRPSAGQA